jgi:thiol-disulfide isomerase/thioredoxin
MAFNVRGDVMNSRRPYWTVMHALAGVLSIAATASAQDHVRWSARVDSPVTPGSRFIITLSAEIERGWHIYSLTQPEGGPLALRISVPDGQPLTVVGPVRGPEPERQTLPAPAVPQELHSGTVSFDLPVKTLDGISPGRTDARIAIRFQSCSDDTCLPPRTIELPVTFTVAKQQSGPDLSGRWDGSIAYDSVTIPFPLELKSQGSAVAVSFFNGSDRIESTASRWSGDSLVVAFDHLATELRVLASDTLLSGVYVRSGRKELPRVEARRAQAQATVAPAHVPDISGVWLLPADTAKGERTWRFVVQQQGAAVTATILRVDGDAGAHVGAFQDGRFVLNHFDGTRPSQYEVVPTAAGALAVTVRGPRSAAKRLRALRPETARAEGRAEPADFASHTRVADPNTPFRFSFPDLSGKLVSSSDERFKGKVVIVNISGSWCPNCHDEAPFLQELYERYAERGLEIVSLDFEEEEQQPELPRLSAFVERYGITYTVLIAGEPSQLNEKVPQAENLNSWPTTFFLGRDGRVDSVHAGFAAKASGEFHEQQKRAYVAIVERLLADAVAKR